MRIAVHDYSGHPFQVQLSRELARRGHEVVHLYCPSYLSGKGAVERRPDDPESFAVRAVPLDGTFAKYSPWTRLRQEREYARRLLAHLDAVGPEVVLSSNTPLLAQARIVPAVRRRGVRFVFWQQDVYSIAMAQAARARVPLAGRALGRWFVSLERRLLLESDAVVTIADDFRSILLSWGLPPERVTVIENWAPLDELPALDRPTAWAEEHGLAGSRVLLYSGTLGLKHDPELLLGLAAALAAEPDVRVVVVSAGPGADRLRDEARRRGLPGLIVLPFQPYERLAEVHASADVLLLVLAREAGVFSVPSKVLSYLCAGRAILAAVPAENLAARRLGETGGGVVVDPGEPDAFVAAARRLLDDAPLRQRLGAAARVYAENAFDIQAVADRFEPLLVPPARRPARTGVDERGVVRR